MKNDPSVLSFSFANELNTTGDSLNKSLPHLTRVLGDRKLLIYKFISQEKRTSRFRVS